MAPRKNKKKVSAATKSTSEEVVSSKRSLRRLKKAVVASESTPEEVVSDKKIVEDEKGGDAEEPVPTPKVRKPCTWLKLDRLNPELGSKSSLQSSEQGKEAKPATQVRDPKDNKRKINENGEGKGHYHPEKLDRLNPELGSKSSLQSCEQGKEAKPTAQVRDLKDNKRKRNEKGEGKGHHPVTNEKQNACPEKKEKEIINGRHEDTKKMDDESEKELGGLIFMCNAKTKPDCFRYQIMGVPANKKEVVMSIKRGLKFFLYDYDLKVMYGVFEASSAGGMKLEPAAFGGAFPAQVRFIVHKDCLPLPESVFKKAIKDSYDNRTNKFRTELTVKQVKNLIDMFNPTPLLHPNGKSVVQEPTFCPVPSVASLSEESLMRQRYLNKCGNSDTHGKSIPLHQEKQFSDNHVFHSTGPPRDTLFLTEQEYRSNGLRQGRHLLPATAGDNVSNPWEPIKLDVELKHLLRNPVSTSTDSPDPFFIGEKEYRTYGLRGPQQAPRKNSYDPYDEATTSLVNRYLSLPMTTAIPAESYPLAGREPYISDLSHTSHMQSHPARTIPDGDRAFVPHSFREQSVFNQRSYSLNASCEPSELSRGVSLQRQADLTSAPVSHRYSFAGPSLSQHR